MNAQIWFTYRRVNEILNEIKPFYSIRGSLRGDSQRKGKGLEKGFFKKVDNSWPLFNLFSSFQYS